MKINISIDDVSPHPKSSTKVLDQCYELIKIFPYIKFTLFVPTSYWRKYDPCSTSKPFNILEHQDFIQKIKSLPENNFEIGIHGIHHSSDDSNNNEMKHLNYDDATKYISKICKTFERCGINIQNVVRPCGWAISDQAAKAFDDFFNNNWTLTLHKNYFDEKLKNLIEGRNIHVVWCDSCPPFLPLQYKNNLEIVYHACEWDRNYLSEDFVEDLKKFLLESDSRFRFIREIKNG